MAGFVYVMSNPDHAKLKIGMTDRDPEKYRVKELSNTSVAEDYSVEYWALVEDETDIERKVHRHFDDQRPNKNREFFTCSIGEAISAIQTISGETRRDEQNNYAKYEEYKRQQEEQERRQREEEERLEKQRLEEERLEKLRIEMEEQERKRVKEEQKRKRLEEERLERLRIEEEEQARKRVKEEQERKRLEEERLERLRIEEEERLERLRIQEEERKRLASEELEREFQKRKTKLITSHQFNRSVDWDSKLLDLPLYISGEAKKLLDDCGYVNISNSYRPNLSVLVNDFLPLAKKLANEYAPVNCDITTGMNLFEAELKKNFPENSSAIETVDEKLLSLRRQIEKYKRSHVNDAIKELRLEIRRSLEPKIREISLKIDELIEKDDTRKQEYLKQIGKSD